MKATTTFFCLLLALSLDVPAWGQAHDVPSERPPAPVRYPGRINPPRPTRPAPRPEPTPTPGPSYPYPDYRPAPPAGNYSAAYAAASRGRLRNCRITRFRWYSRPAGCLYRLRVNGRPYPTENACSASSRAALWGCAVGSQQQNMGCLVLLAMNNGVCR